MSDSQQTGQRTELNELARAEVRSRYLPQLAACFDQIDRTLELVNPWSGRGLESPEDRLIAALFVRTTNTHWAALRVLESGFGDQGLMLQRSMFEDMVDLHWIAANPALAIERIGQHDRHSAMVMADSVKKYPHHFDPELLKDVSYEGRKELDALFSKYGTKSWTGSSLHERIANIEKQWDSEESRELLHFFHDVAHRLNNQILHVTADSLASMFRADDDSGTGQYFRLGPSESNMESAMLGVFWTYSQSATLLFSHFGFSQLDSFSIRSAELMNVFASPSESELQNTGRNDDCPCGSTRKYKRCHLDLLKNFELAESW